MPKRILVVNADDFGQNTGINQGIIEAHERGIVTSASLMVRWPAAPEAAEYARRNRRLGLGLHLDLGEWTYRQNHWQARYQVVPLDDHAAISTEIRQQVATFRSLVGRSPSHLDSHQHVHHREGPARTVAEELAQQLGIPLRHVTPNITYCGHFYGRSKSDGQLLASISTEALLQILRSIGPGITELACHPGYAYDLDSDYRDERLKEVATLCDPIVKAVLEDERITVCSFESPDVIELTGCRLDARSL